MMEADGGSCPFLVAVMADRLWVYPVPAYCRRPDARVRVPAMATFERVCTANYSMCPGYQASRVTRGASRRLV